MMSEHLLSSDRKQLHTTKPVVILGGGGDGRVVLEIIRRMIRSGSELYPARFLDDERKASVDAGLTCSGYLYGLSIGREALDAE